LPAQISTGCPAKVRRAADAPGVIVGQVPLIFGRYCAAGLPPPPLLELLELLELALASLTPPLVDPELGCVPELPLDPELGCVPELLPEPELLPPELELSLDPELPFDPELFAELLDPEAPELDPLSLPGSWVTEAAQLAMSDKPVKAKLKPIVQRIAPSVAAPENASELPPTVC
jgi:hypothetical protein